MSGPHEGKAPGGPPPYKPRRFDRIRFAAELVYALVALGLMLADTKREEAADWIRQKLRRRK